MIEEVDEKRGNLRKGVYILPNLITTGGAVCRILRHYRQYSGVIPYRSLVHPGICGV